MHSHYLPSVFCPSSIFLLYSLKSERTIFLFFSCLNGNSFPSNFTRNFLISKKFRCCDLNPKSAPSFVPHHQILKTTTHFHCLVRLCFVVFIVVFVIFLLLFLLPPLSSSLLLSSSALPLCRHCHYRRQHHCGCGPRCHHCLKF